MSFNILKLLKRREPASVVEIEVALANVSSLREAAGKRRDDAQRELDEYILAGSCLAPKVDALLSAVNREQAQIDALVITRETLQGRLASAMQAEARGKERAQWDAAQKEADELQKLADELDQQARTLGVGLHAFFEQHERLRKAVPINSYVPFPASGVWIELQNRIGAHSRGRAPWHHPTLNHQGLREALEAVQGIPLVRNYIEQVMSPAPASDAPPKAA